eukprot:Em0012g231a
MAVPAVLSPQVVRDEKHKVDEALRYIKAKLAEARTLERRKRLFIRHCTNFKIANHVEIHLWIGLYYSDMDEEKWENVMQDDITYDYPTFGHGMENVN